MAARPNRNANPRRASRHAALRTTRRSVHHAVHRAARRAKRNAAPSSRNRHAKRLAPVAPDAAGIFAARIEPLLQSVSLRVSPTVAERESERKLAHAIMAKLQTHVPQGVRIEFVGSAARDTGLRGALDLDVFVAFPRSHTREDIVKRTVRAVKRSIKADWVMHYAEHPYLKAEVFATGPTGGLASYDVEVIPCFQTQMGEKVKSAVDRSILHMDYLQRRLTPLQRRDVRCLKALLKAAGIYGAELEIGGFSGLVCEQLMLRYGSLAALLTHATTWRFPVLIDAADRYANPADAKKVLAQFDAPIVLPDAVDATRNAAAAITLTNASKFVTLARAFVAKPSEGFFVERAKPLTAIATRKAILRSVNERQTTVVLAWMPLPSGIVRDIAVPQLRKMEGDLRKQAEHREFRVLHSASRATESHALLVFDLSTADLPRTQVVQGPPVSSGAANVAAFIKQDHFLRGPFISGERVIGEKPREFRTLEAFLHETQRRPGKFGVPSNYVKLWKRAKVARLDRAAVHALPHDLAQELNRWLGKKDAWLG